MVRTPASGYILTYLYNLLYGPLAPVYDQVAYLVSLGHWQTWIMSAIPYLQGPRVLEIGPGPGHLQAVLAGRVSICMALEASTELLGSFWKNYVRKVGCSWVVNGYAQFIPFSNNSFDQIVATFPGDYIVHPATLAELRRVLRPGGLLLILPAAQLNSSRLLPRLLACILSFIGAAPPSAQSFSETRPAIVWEEHFRSAGFETEWRSIPCPDSLVHLLLATR